MNALPPPFAVVVPWHNEKQKDEFLAAWHIQQIPQWLFLQQDMAGEGCARTKNAGIKRAYNYGADVIVVLDDDCYPPASPDGKGPLKGYTLENFADDHITALKPQPVRMIYSTGNPSPRGMPYRNRHIVMPVAASMGFWQTNPDYDAISSLVLGPQANMEVARVAMFRHYFPFSGMNFAFRREWVDCAQLIDVPRWDDIWMGFLWQREAYSRGHCFNLCGPVVTHFRQSNVFANLQDEVKYLELNERLWKIIYQAPVSLTTQQLRDMLLGDKEKIFERVSAAQEAFGTMS